MTCGLHMSMVVGREAPTTPGCLKKLLKTRSMASHGHRKVCVFNLNPNIWFSKKIQIRFCVAAGSAAATTPVQPELQHSAAGSALPAALCCSLGCTGVAALLHYVLQCVT